MAEAATASRTVRMTASWTAGVCRSSQRVCVDRVCRPPRWYAQAASPPSQNTSAGTDTAAHRSVSLPPTVSQNAVSTATPWSGPGQRDVVGRAIRDRGADLGPVPDVVAIPAAEAGGWNGCGIAGREGEAAGLTRQVARLLVGRPVLRCVR